MRTFEVGITRDFKNDREEIVMGTRGLDCLAQFGHIRTAFFETHHSPVLKEQLKDLDAVISFAPKYNAESLSLAEASSWGLMNCSSTSPGLCLTLFFIKLN